MKLQRVPINQARKAIEPHIRRIGEFSHRPRLFDEIVQACTHDSAFLFMSDPAGESFVVLKPIKRHDKTILFIWAAYCDEGDAISKYLDDIKELAVVAGASNIEFMTSREGFERIAPKHGWEKQSTLWSMSV